MYCTCALCAANVNVNRSGILVIDKNYQIYILSRNLPYRKYNKVLYPRDGTPERGSWRQRDDGDADGAECSTSSLTPSSPRPEYFLRKQAIKNENNFHQYHRHQHHSTEHDVIRQRSPKPFDSLNKLTRNKHGDTAVTATVATKNGRRDSRAVHRRSKFLNYRAATVPDDRNADPITLVDHGDDVRGAATGRAGHFFWEKLQIPRGKVNNIYESALLCAFREFYEETRRLPVGHGRLCGQCFTLTWVDDDHRWSYNMFVIMVDGLAELTDDEHVEFTLNHLSENTVELLFIVKPSRLKNAILYERCFFTPCILSLLSYYHYMRELLKHSAAMRISYTNYPGFFDFINDFLDSVTSIKNEHFFVNFIVQR